VLAVYTAVTWRMGTESRPICYFTGLFDKAALRDGGSCLNRPEAGSKPLCPPRQSALAGNLVSRLLFGTIPGAFVDSISKEEG
jgi:hypothetical protein